ncbi:RNA polymerase sigma factor SigW [Bacillus horti]|uniref:RNA polymerase sigma factor n=1 Tax=Caldalkalibacillus horti TaxID=77523 RepID=A0ABT9VYQ1_9BACI|nr:RNA polymerase sigma factor SigW [Bacillus horti]MDQ0166121.1 RNA polymerase sigma-70 factor (ECF subfamily) [Bacillus horti]
MEQIEWKLVKRIRKGDREAFAEIVELYKHKLYQLGYRMLGNPLEAEEIAQESFLRVYSNIGRYDQNHKFSTWIYRIATNLCIDRLRKRKIVYSLDQEVVGAEGLDMYSQLADEKQRTPEAEVVTLEIQEQVQKAIDQLPPQYKSIMILRYLQDLSLQEISDIVDLPVTTIKTRVHRGREALKKLLQHV